MSSNRMIDQDDFIHRTPSPSLNPDDTTGAWTKIQSSQQFLKPPDSSIVPYNRKQCTRLVFMSDTHGSHRQIKVPKADYLLHGGDFTRKGEVSTVQDLSEYFDELQRKGVVKEVVSIAGNHDLGFHKEFYNDSWKNFHRKFIDPDECRNALKNCVYLEDSSYTLSKGRISVYGSPWSPFYFGWAFNLHRGNEILQKWKKIPEKTDILITHGPPIGRGDLTDRNVRAGCMDLLNEIQDRVRPRIHVFGHIHEGQGITYDGTTLFVNACNVDLAYRPVHFCSVVDLPHDQSQPPIVVKPDCKVKGSELSKWFLDHGFKDLANSFESNVTNVEEIPSGNALLSSPIELSEKMQLHRAEPSIRKSLQEAMSVMYIEAIE